MARIAHLVMAHTDPEHLVRLSNRLTEFSDVFIHIDSNIPIEKFQEPLKQNKRCYFVKTRHRTAWGSWAAVSAEITLLEEALATGTYDRFVFLQGSDYPIKSNHAIQSFFDEHNGIEFLRACRCTDSPDKYFYGRCRHYVFPNKRNVLKKIADRITRKLDIKLRDGWIYDSGDRYPVYWGSAQWAITRDFAQYAVVFYKNHKEFNRWFYNAFPADEMYFATIIMNSEFAVSTIAGGPEAEKPGLTNWRNLHYFEYGKAIRVLTYEDKDLLVNGKELCME